MTMQEAADYENGRAFAASYAARYGTREACAALRRIINDAVVREASAQVAGMCDVLLDRVQGEVA